MILNHSDLAAKTQSAVGPQPQSRAELRRRHIEPFGSANSTLPHLETLDWPSDRQHTAYYNPLDSGNEGKDENLLPPDEQDTEDRPSES